MPQPPHFVNSEKEIVNSETAANAGALLEGHEEPGERRKIEISLVVSLEMCNFAPKVGMKMCKPTIKVDTKTCNDVGAHDARISHDLKRTSWAMYSFVSEPVRSPCD